MTDHRNQSGKDSASKHPSWRGKSSPGTSWGWRDLSDATGEPISWGRKLAFFLLGLVILVGCLVFVLLRTPQASPFCAISITRYASPLPPNRFAQEDLDRFRQAFADRDIRFESPNVEGLKKAEFLRALQNWLSRVEPGGPDRGWLMGRDRGTVMIYVSGHGAVDGTGHPCLILRGQDALDSSQWLPIRELLSVVSNEPRLQNATKLLLLDANRIREDWQFGVLQNAFADSIVRVVEEAQTADPNLFVMNSTSGVESGLALPELGASLFGLAVAEGLDGAAASGWSKRVSLGALESYVQRRVAQLARELRVTTQSPQLISRQPNTHNIMLAFAQGNAAPVLSSGNVQILQARHQILNDLWTQHRNAKQNSAHLAHPLVWAQLNHHLTHLEQILAAGTAYDFDRESRTVLDLLQRLPKAGLELRLSCGSLPLMERFAPLSKQEYVQAEQALQELLQQAPVAATESSSSEALDVAPESSTPQPESLESQAEPAAKDVATDPPGEEAKYGGRAAASAAWRWLTNPDSSVDRTAVQELITLIANAPGATDATSAQLIPEVHLLKILDNQVPWDAVSQREISETLRAYERTSEIDALASQVEVSDFASPVECDVRALYWIANGLRQAETQMRRALDELILGGMVAQTDARSKLIDTSENGLIQRLADAQEKLTAAWTIRDRVWFELPELGERLVNDQPSSEVMQRLLELIQLNHMLGQTLDEVPADVALADSANTELFQQAARVDQLFRELKGRFGQISGRDEDLLDLTKLDASHLRSVEELLATSLLEDQREQLRGAYVAKLTDLAEQVRSIRPVDPSDASKVPIVGPQATDYLDAVFSTPSTKHPAMELLDVSKLPERFDGIRQSPSDALAGPVGDSTEQRLQWLALAGEEVRQRLARLDELQTKLLSLSQRELAQRALPVSQARQGLSAADRLRRAAAGLSCENELGEDPCALLRQLDTAHLLLWHAEKSLDDFWGPEVPTRENLADEFFFAHLAKHYLSQLDAPGFRSIRNAGLTPTGHLATLNDQCTRYVDAAIDWPDPIVGSLYVGDEEKTAHPSVAVAPLNISDSERTGFVSGHAAVFLQRDDNVADASDDLETMMDVRRACDLSAEAEQQEAQSFSLDVDQALEESPDAEVGFSAVCFFRGHRRQHPFAVSRYQGTTVVHNRPRYDAPSILVKSDQKQIGLVLFVLDCSGSMDYRHLAEGPLQTRLEIAKSSFRKVMQSLDRSYHRVGLIVYGHSARYDQSGKVQRRSWETRNVMPYENWELIWDFGDVLRSVDDERKLDRLQPYGQTPLYEAIHEGIRLLNNYRTRAGQPIVATRDLVVLTDGGQYNPQVKRLTTPRQVIDLQKQGSVRVHIVGFTSEPDFQHEDYRKRVGDAYYQAQLRKWQEEKERWQANKGELQKIDTDGEIVEVASPERLADQLMDAVGRDQYFVQKSEDRRPDRSQWLYLGNEYRDPDFQGPASYVVEVVNSAGQTQAASTMRLEGGERIEVQLDRLASPPQLKHQRYVRDLKQNLVQENVRGYYIGPLATKQTAPEVFTIRISIQNQQPDQFSPRPSQIWAEVRPDTGEQKPIYYFQDVSFENDRPVPVIQLPLQDYVAKSAEVQLWFRFDPVDTTEDSLAGPTDQPATFRYQNAELQVKPLDAHTVLVTEKHDAESEDFPLRLNLGRPAKVIRRMYNVEGGWVRHRFEFGDETQLAPADLVPRVGPNPIRADNEARWIAVDPIHLTW